MVSGQSAIRNPQSEIAVSVVVPTCRRPALLRRCLVQLLAQDLGAGYEILVADDGLDRDTELAVEALRARWPRPALRYLAVGKASGPAAARNRACAAAFGRIIAFTDDDCVPALDWLRQGIRPFGEEDVVAVAGRIVMPLPRHPTDYEANATGLTRATFVTANCFCRRDALVAARGFDERFRRAWREDSDLYFTLLERGGRVVHEPAALVVHPIRPAGWGISVRQQRNALFEALLFKKHPRLYWTKAQAVRPWLYYLILAALATVAAGWLAGRAGVALAGAAAWAGLTARFCARRLRGTSRRPGHVLEMALTSAVIPPAACFWRLAGAVRHRVWFF